MNIPELIERLRNTLPMGDTPQNYKDRDEAADALESMQELENHRLENQTNLMKQRTILQKRVKELENMVIDWEKVAGNLKEIITNYDYTLTPNTVMSAINDELDTAFGLIGCVNIPEPPE